MSPFFLQLRQMYAFVAISYGAIRKSHQLKNAHVVKYEINEIDRETIKRRVPILLVDKVALTVLSAFSSVYLWPVYLYWDMQMLEIYNKSLKPSTYGFIEPKHALDYLYR